MKRVYLFLGLILLLGLALRVFVASDGYLHEWDERYHALVAKNMMNEPFAPKLYKETPLPYDYRHWTENHIWVHKQPLPLWCMALSMKVFGVNEWALRFPSVLLSTLAIFLTYWIGKELFGTKVGLWAAFFHAINGLVIEITGGRVATDHPDLFFWFFIELSVCAALLGARKKWGNPQSPVSTFKISLIHSLCGVFMGAAILCKWLPALIVLPIWAILQFQNKENSILWKFGQLMLVLFGATVVALPWQIYIHQAFPKEAAWESQFNVRHIFEALEGHEHFFLYHFDNLRLVFGELIIMPLGWALWRCYVGHRPWRLYFLMLWIFVPVLFFTFVKTKMQGYPMLNAPALFVTLGLFCTFAARYAQQVQYPKMLKLLLFLLIALPIRYSIERVKPFAKSNPAQQWTQSYKVLGQQYASQKVILLGAKHPIEAMFYTNMIAYPYIPTTSQLQSLKAAGYTILYDN